MNTTDTINAKLTPGEFVIKREAVNMIGEPFLNALNNMPEAGGGHAEIDKLIAMASMANSQNMNMGGPVEEEQQGYMGGGMLRKQMYQYGGMSKPKMYMDGGMANKMMYEDGGMANKMMYEDGGMANRLKPVPSTNPGLAKLPEEVRNNMGYMQNGGMASVDSMNNQSMNPMDRLRSSVDSYNQEVPQQIPAGAMAQLQERQMMEQQALEEAMYMNAKQSLLELMMEDMKAKGMYSSDMAPSNDEYLKSLGGTSIRSDGSLDKDSVSGFDRDSLMMFPSNPPMMMPK